MAGSEVPDTTSVHEGLVYGSGNLGITLRYMGDGESR